MPGPQRTLAKSVVSIIDHHADAGKYKKVKGDDRRIANADLVGIGIFNALRPSEPIRCNDCRLGRYDVISCIQSKKNYYCLI